ncbi:hypothetical protein DPMN_036780 [Dreissena polymorpha]|uniref:Uncharacterized protein n=1 Tax=Dreissena polymorpha TaxID=45954 RepID=A0A9D4MBG1_DREPO|nr:hypothetical protein DPMN_036780 [Dreissena polymorpha]
MLECEFTVTDVKERIDELKEIGKVIFGEFEYYEAISHFEVPTSNTEKHSNLSVATKMPKVNTGTQSKISANTEVQRADTGTHTNVPVVTDEKRNISLSIRPDKKRSMCCSCFGSKYAREDQTVESADYESPLEAASAEGYEIIHNPKINDIQEQIHKNTKIQNPSFSSEVDDNLDVYSDVTFTTLEIPNNKTTLVLYKNNDFQQKVSFKWVTDVKNGIIVYDEFEQTLVLTGTDGCVKVVHQIKEQPLALIRVSSERVTTLFVEGKACKMRCYFISDTAINLKYAEALPNEIQNQFLGAWYDILNDKYAVACNGTLYVLTAAGKIESKHEFKKRDGNWEGIRAAYDFHKRLLFVLDSRKKQLECQSIDKKEVVWEKTNDGEEFRPTNVCLTKDTLYIISGDQLIPVSCEDGTHTGDPIELEDLDENILACHFVEGKNAMILTTTSRTVGFLKLDRNQQVRVVKESADVNLTDINITQF